MLAPQINDNFANRYLLKKLIGVGGYSQVWLAGDIKAGSMEVAIKIYAPEKGLDSDGIETFGKEFTLVFNLNHTHLLRPMYYDVIDGSPYFVMQYCPNGSLFKRIGEIKEPELARFMQQASSALKYLHAQNPPIIHQDIKPDNFLIDKYGNYLLADFGISSKIRRTLTKSMGAHASTGTLAYMPPEKFSADKQIIKAGDIFSLGVTMYELLTGDLPFGDHGGMVILTGAQVPNLPSGFNPELNSLLKRCMAKEPWERPNAEQLEDIANRFLQTGHWQTVGKDEPENNPEPHKDPEQPHEGRKTQQIQQRRPEPQTPKPEPPQKRNFIAEIVLGIILVVTVIGIFAILWPKGPSAREMEETRIADSIRGADSIAMVQAEQQHIADSIVAVQSKRIEVVQDEQQRTADNTIAIQNNRFKIGDLYAGGIIFYLDGTGEHGKVCADKDQSYMATWDEAISICNNLNLNGYKEWCLPSKNELYMMYENLHKNGLGGFVRVFYWSSSEGSAAIVWIQSFYSGSMFVSNKNNTYHVRAIRSF